MWWRKSARQPERPVLRCSFCNKGQDDVKKLIAGPTIFICNECIDVCNDIIADDERSTAGSPVRADDPLRWPKTIECALCRTPILVNEGVFIADNRGTLCADCITAVQAATPSGPPYRSR